MYKSQEDVLEGIMQYVKHEIIPALPDYVRLLAGAALLHNTGRLSDLLKELSNGTVLKVVGAVNSDGKMDVEEWAQQLRQAMAEFCGGKVEIKLPGLAPMVFRDSDIDTLKRYICK